MLDKTYNPRLMEPDIFQKWEKSGVFACQPNSDKKPLTIIMPPPNVTGTLHMGHALTFTLQDILTRFYRMQGRDALWQPGKDHAGIATQFVVERQLAEHGKTRFDLGREKFLEEVWRWKEQSGSTITNQLRTLGASADWSRDIFTMDPGPVTAVRTAFVQLYKDGLIYRDKRLVNWDPKLQTAVSDLEVQQRPNKGHLWYIKYPLTDDPSQSIIVATTRPETMLGDSAVAVHPDDERYQHLIGKTVTLPLTGRQIPIIADDYADPETGSGAVKITPAHDFNDFEVGQRHKLPLYNVLDEKAHLNDEVPETYRGLDRFVARKKIVEDLDAQGFIEKIDPIDHTIPYGDRSGVVLEPRLTDQWFVNAEVLAGPALKVVKDGKIKFFPESWTNVYYDWLNKIQPWCISRQIWWGHRIPAWYGPDSHIFVASSDEEAQQEAKKHYGKEVSLTQDPDVLDTWFSSAMWPFSTLGWPDQTPELKRYYPSDIMVTGFDIIFFWVARMIMMGLYFMKDVPFHTVYIHALVKDAEGQKMSKTKGNIIDPLDVTTEYGTDALRYTLASLAIPGQDIRLSTEKIVSSRNFVTKIWNAARYCLMNGCAFDPQFNPNTCQYPINRWLLAQLKDCADKMADAMAGFKFHQAAHTLYHFVWGDFCDWYLEFTKFMPAEAADETKKTTAWAFHNILKLMHPLMPYVSEVLWSSFSKEKGQLIGQAWPEFSGMMLDKKACQEVQQVIDLITTVRALRAESPVPAGDMTPLYIKDADAKLQQLLQNYWPFIERLARINNIDYVTEKPGMVCLQDVFQQAILMLPLGAGFDTVQEKEKLAKEIQKIEIEVAKINAKLDNQDFIARAPEDVVAEQKERKHTYLQRKNKLEMIVQQL